MTQSKKPRRPEANATGPRPIAATDEKGKAVRISPEAKELVIAHAVEMSARQGRLVSMREALDEIIYIWKAHNDANH